MSSRIPKRKPRIFIGLGEIAGYFGSLKKGFDELGVEATFVSLNKHSFKYHSLDCTNNLVLQYRYFVERRATTPRPQLFAKVWWIGLVLVTQFLLFVWSIRNFDVFIFGYGTSSFYSLPILRLLGKTIIVVYFGSDARPAFIDGALMETSTGRSTDECIEIARKQKHDSRKVEKYAHIVINHVATAHFAERAFVPWLYVGFPFSHDVPSFETTYSKGEMVRILHCPSSPEAKGTPSIRQAIDHLQSQGYPIDFIEITGKPHAFVLQALSTCDFVVDQLYSDTPMAGFATEAAFFGKPAIVGGYTQEFIRQTTPEDMIPPSLYCHPEELVQAIETLITDVDYRQTLGKQAQQFVQTHWTPKKVAERYVQLIEGDIPNEWLFDPRNIQYLLGGGLSEQRAKHLVRSVIEKGGKEALQLADKPELERLFMEFAYTASDERVV